MALKYEPANALQIQRDLVLLQLQIRDFKGHCITRQKLLQDNPKLPINWVSFALSYHLLKDYNQTVEVLKSLWKIVENDNGIKKQEINEIVVYWGLVYIESKSYKECLLLLQKHQTRFLDKQSFNQYLYICYKELNQTDKAISSLKKLIEINPNNLEYYQQEIELKQLNDEQVIDYYEQQLKLERNQKNQFMKLEILKHQNNKAKFMEQLKDFIKPFYKNGIPSLFNKLKQLYRGEYHSALKTAIRLVEYELEINKKKIYSLLTLAGYYARNYRECSRALVKLESMEGLSEQELSQYEQIAVEIFTKHPPDESNEELQQCMGTL